MVENVKHLRVDAIVTGANADMINTSYGPDMVEMSWKEREEKRFKVMLGIL